MQEAIHEDAAPAIVCTENGLRNILYQYEVRADLLQNPEAINSIWIALPNGLKSRFIRATGWETT
jgi:hypothetical protein